jgi:hypothetical protein
MVYTKQFGGAYGIPVPWKFERVTAAGQSTVIKEGTDPMTSDSTIAATYTYQ